VRCGASGLLDLPDTMLAAGDVLLGVVTQTFRALEHAVNCG